MALLSPGPEPGSVHLDPSLWVQPQEPFPLLQELTVWSKPLSRGLPSPLVPLGGKDSPEAAAGVRGIF